MLPDRLNVWLDRIPRTTVVVGARTVPAFRSLGILGYVVGGLVVAACALATGYPLTTYVGLTAAAGSSFFVWGLLRRAVTGRETLVLIEYTWAALGAVALYLWAAGGPVVAGLDLLAVGLGPFLAAGRIGCLTVGCCHGHPAAIGVRYGPGHGHPPRLHDRRLFPVPLVEAIALLAITVVTVALVGRTPGTATVWFLLAYAAVRFGLEALRGDRRPRVLGLPVARATCAVQGAGALVAAEAWLVPGGPGRAVAVAAAVLGACTLAGLALDRQRWRHGGRLLARGSLDELHDRIADLVEEASADAPGDVPRTDRIATGVTVAASRTPEGVCVSLANAGDASADLARAVGADGPLVVGDLVLWTVPRPVAGMPVDLDERSPAREPEAGPSAPGVDPVVNPVRRNGTMLGVGYFARAGER